MYLIRKNGATSNVIRRVLRSSATGQGLTGLAFNTSGLIISTVCDNEASATAYTAAGSTIETIATLGTFAAPTTNKCRFKEVDATNHPGLYEFQFADARFAVANAKTLRITISGAANLLQQEIVVQLTAVDVDSATGFVSSVPSVVGAVGSVSGNVGGNVAGSVGSIATGGIAAASFAAGAIDNAAIATDAIGSAELAASAVTEIQSGLSTLDAAGVRTAVGLAFANLDTQLGTIDDYLDTEIAAIKAKTDNLPASPAATSDIPSAASVADAVWDEAQSGHAGAGTFGSYLDAAVSGVSTGGVSAGDIADAVWDEALAGHAGAGSAGATLSNRASQASVDTIDDYVDTEVAAIKAKTDNLPSDPADASDIAASFTSIANTLTTISSYIDTEVAAIKAKTDNLPASPAAVSDIPTVADIWTTVLTESYRATGAAGTAAQLMHEILQNLTEFGISGTTKTVKKFDGSTTAKTYTLNDADTPTSITEAT